MLKNVQIFHAHTIHKLFGFYSMLVLFIKMFGLVSKGVFFRLYFSLFLSRIFRKINQPSRLSEKQTAVCARIFTLLSSKNIPLSPALLFSYFPQ